mgnify:CR=1 FL=1
MGRATLAPRLGMSAEIPPLRETPTLTMRDMGMGGMDHGAMGDMSGMDHDAMPAMDDPTPVVAREETAVEREFAGRLVLDSGTAVSATSLIEAVGKLEADAR